MGISATEAEWAAPAYNDDCRCSQPVASRKPHRARQGWGVLALCLLFSLTRALTGASVAVAVASPGVAPSARMHPFVRGGPVLAQRAASREAMPPRLSHRGYAPQASHLRRVILVLIVTVGIISSQGQAALATGSAHKAHLGERLAVFLQNRSHLPNWMILMVLSAMPLIELRGGVPVGLWMGLGVSRVMLLCILGNMLPIPLILFALRSQKVNDLLAPVLRRARKKTKAIGAHDQWVGVAAFVGVPLPGTGAWTGAMVAHLLGMDIGSAVTSILTGVCVASAIMASLTLAGWYGCAVACCVVAVALGSRYLPLPRSKAKSKAETEAKDEPDPESKTEPGPEG